MSVSAPPKFLSYPSHQNHGPAPEVQAWTNYTNIGSFGKQIERCSLKVTRNSLHDNILGKFCSIDLTFINHITSIKYFDFSTLYTTIPDDKLKSRPASIIRISFIFKNGNRRYKYLDFGHEETYFVKEHPDSKKQVL